MSTKSIDRRGISAVSLLAFALPGLMMAGGMALGYRTSSARRLEAGVWASYVAGEVAGSAIAEAAHYLRVDDLFDPDVFGRTSRPEDFAAHLLGRMILDDDLSPITRQFKSISEESREYRSVTAGAREVRRMLVAIMPPPVRKRVRVPGLALRVAVQNPCVRANEAGDLEVHVLPIVFRREFVEEVAVRFPDPATGRMRDGTGPAHQWVAWGVARFDVRVRTGGLNGVTTHLFEAERRFALRSGIKPGDDVLKISSLNLRFAMTQVEP